MTGSRAFPERDVGCHIPFPESSVSAFLRIWTNYNKTLLRFHLKRLDTAYSFRTVVTLGRLGMREGGSKKPVLTKIG